MTLINKAENVVMRAMLSRAPKIKKYKRKLTASVESSGVIKQGVTLLYPSYQKYFYCDKTTGEGYFFRCKPIDEKGKFPVVIYQHGNGMNRAGKNDIQMKEFSKLIKKLDAHKCHQIAIHLDVACEYNRPEYSRALDGIISYLQNTYGNVDFDRIYLAGTSHGGYGCVYECLRNPGKYAAAVISMAYTYNSEYPIPMDKCDDPYVRRLTDEDYKTLSKTPFYISWAKDDCELMVVSNTLLSERLENNNGDLKVKIYEKGGHTISADFFENSDWADRMFEKSL